MPLFAARLQDIAAAEPARVTPPRGDRRLAAAAAATVADVLARWSVNYDGASVGLRGGKWSYEGDHPVVFDLAVDLVPGVEVTGTPAGASRTARSRRASQRVRTTDEGDIRISWSTRNLVRRQPSPATSPAGASSRRCPRRRASRRRTRYRDSSAGRPKRGKSSGGRRR